MKKLIMAIILPIMLLFVESNAQDVEPTALVVSDTLGNLVTLSPNDSLFSNDGRFIIGWHFGGGQYMSEALNCNQNQMHKDQINKPEMTSNLLSGTRLICQVANMWSDNRSSDPHSQAIGMQFEPTLKIDNPGDFNVRPNDLTNSIFGFKYIHEDIVISDSDYSLRLFADPSSTYLNDTVLSSVWPQGELYANHEKKPTKSQYDEISTAKMYLSINLSRLDEGTDRLSSDTVLIIKLPYVGCDGQNGNFNGYIKFNTLPSRSVDDTVMITNNGLFRGVFQNDSAVSETQEFIVTKSMLPENKNPITLSALFICNSDTSNVNNPRLKYKGETIKNSNSIYIDSLDIEVIYKGGCDVAIDWLRFETPRAQNLLRGEYDEDMQIQIEKVVKQFTADEYKIKGIKLVGFYTRDEPNPSYWAALHYLGRLTGGMGVTSEGSSYPELKNHYIDSWCNWESMTKMGMQVAAPYIGIGGTYRSILHNPNNSDVLHSGYETAMSYEDGDKNETIPSLENTLQNDNLQSYYNTDLHEAWSTQYDLEYNLYIKKYAKYDSDIYRTDNGTTIKSSFYFLYSDRPWWGQAFVCPTWDGDKFKEDGETRRGSLRASTGEEIGLIANNFILMGAKGVIYDRENSEDPFLTGVGYGQKFYDSVNGYLGLPDSGISYENAYTFLNKDSIGGDFLTPGAHDDYSGIDSLLPLNYHTRTGQDSNRVYIGRKSTRIALKHVHDLIRHAEEELLDMRLQAWYGKGFRVWYNQHPDSTSSDTLMRKYVDIDNILTRPIDRTVPDSINIPYYENNPIDSGFYDITLHRHVSNEMEDVFYIGVQNRRTDPLIVYKDSLDQDNVIFLAMAEFEDLCRTGGKDPYDLNPTALSAQDWRDYWWKRLGCREITIPFNYESADSNEYALLKVQELGHDMTPDMELNFWRQPYMYHNIDTIVGEDKAITLNMLPGEGKILKVTVMKPGRDVAGKLDHSNQNKLVAYPDYDLNGNETDKIRYHLTYYRPVPEPQDTSKKYNCVFYRRSEAMDKNSDYSNIVWENEIALSNTFMVNCDPTDLKALHSCDYPSIVVKKYGTDLYAYVVYMCDKELSNLADYIVESKLKVNGEIEYQNNGRGYEVGRFHGREHDESRTSKLWGTPVINSSDDGLYYAWSDSLASGLTIGFKDYSPGCALVKDTIKFAVNSSEYCVHPSVNSYSDSGDVCSLVWSEYEPITKNGIIPFTRINYDNGFVLSVPDSAIKPLFAYPHIMEKNVNEDIGSVGTTLYGNIVFPVVQSTLDMNFNQTSIAWSDMSDIGLIPTSFKENKVIHSHNIFISLTTDEYLFGATPILKSNKSFLYSPVLTTFKDEPVYGWDIDNLYSIINYNLGSKIYETKTPALLSILIGLFFGEYQYSTDTGFSRMTPVGITGEQNHLATMQRNNNDSLEEKWKNRRVYESDPMVQYPDVPEIISNANLFYKSSDDELTDMTGLIAYRGGANDFGITPPKLRGDILPITLPREEIQDSVFEGITIAYQSDTLYSNSFKVGGEYPVTADLEFICTGTMSH